MSDKKNEAILVVNKLGKSYEEGKPVLRDVSLSVSKGQVLAILGSSGSGKTTLIKILAGLLQPDEGQVLFHGRNLEGPDEKLVPGHEEIRLVHQDFKLYHRMTVEENIRNALIEYEAGYKQKRTEELLQLCGIGRVKNQYVHEISGGEKQRVAIAMALATEPEILLFDEPFSNLDYQTKSDLLQEVERLAKATGTAIVLITHDSRDAMEVADYLMVLDLGKLIREGTPQQVYRKPEYDKVANLLGLHTVIHQEKEHNDTTVSKRRYGVWAEDVLLHKPRGQSGSVKKVVFAGPVNKLLIAAKNFDIWAYDYSGKIKLQDKVVFALREENIFELKHSL